MGKPMVIWANRTTKVSQRDIVEATGYSNRTVANWVNPKKLTDYPEAIKIMAEKTGKSPRDVRRRMLGDLADNYDKDL